MNGLRFVRTQCNYMMKELADILDVTKASITYWETGTKPIPDKRLAQLSNLFGVDSKYLGEITEEDREHLNNLPRYKKYQGDIHTSFSPDTSSEKIYVLYSDESFKTSYEKHEEMKARYRLVVEDINKLFEVTDTTDEKRFYRDIDLLESAIEQIRKIRATDVSDDDSVIQGEYLDAPDNTGSIEENVEFWHQIVSADPKLKGIAYGFKNNGYAKPRRHDSEFDFIERDEDEIDG